MLRVARGAHSLSSIMALAGVWMMYIAIDSSPAPDFFEVEFPQHANDVDLQTFALDAHEAPQMISLTSLTDAQVSALQRQVSQISPSSVGSASGTAEARRESPVQQPIEQRSNRSEFVRVTPRSEEQEYSPMSELVSRVARGSNSAQMAQTELVEITETADPQAAPDEQVVTHLKPPSQTVDDLIVTIQWPHDVEQQKQFYQNSQQCGLIRSVVIPGGRMMDQQTLLSAIGPKRRDGESLLVRELPDFVRSRIASTAPELAASSHDMVVLFFKQSMDRRLRRLIEASRRTRDNRIHGLYEARRSGLYLAIVESGTGQRTTHQLTDCIG